MMAYPAVPTPVSIADHIISLLSASTHVTYTGEPISQLQHSLQCAVLAATTSPPVDDDTIVAALLHDIGHYIPEDEIHRTLGKHINVSDMIVSSSTPIPTVATKNQNKADRELHSKARHNISPSSPSPSSFSTTTVATTRLAESVGRANHELLGSQYLAALGFSEKVSKLVESHVAAKRYLCTIEPTYYETLSDTSRKSLELFQGGRMREAEKETFAAHAWCEDMCRLRRWDDAAKVVGWEVPGVETWRQLIERVLDVDS